jgi:hypothetical protein
MPPFISIFLHNNSESIFIIYSKQKIRSPYLPTPYRVTPAETLRAALSLRVEDIEGQPHDDGTSTGAAEGLADPTMLAAAAKCAPTTLELAAR